MKIHSLIVASGLAVALSVPAMAQSNTMHRYAQFKYSDSAVTSESRKIRKIAQPP